MLLRDKIDEVKEWIFNLDPILENSDQLKRSDSYSEHLAGKFFPPNKEEEFDFKRKMRERELISASAKKIEQNSETKKIKIPESIEGSLITGWGLEIDKCIIQPIETRKRRIQIVPLNVGDRQHTNLGEKSSILSKKTTHLSLTAKSISENIRVMSAGLTSKIGKAAGRPKLPIIDRPITHHASKHIDNNGRDTPYRPFTSNDSRLEIR